MSEFRCAVLIPCYNEASTIGKVIDDAKKTLPDATIYVYDNNSTDDTASIATKHGAVVRFEHRQGKGNVIRSMFRDINADCYVMVDGDDTYEFSAAAKMVELVKDKKVDMVVGDRLSSTYFEENKRPFHNFGNAMVRGIINWVFRSNIEDIMTGFRAFSRNFVKTFAVLSTGFEIETEMTIHAVHNNMSMENVVIEYRDRPEGSESKLSTFRDGFRVIKMIGKLFCNYRPLAFFTMIACLLAVISIAFFIPVFDEFLKTGLVERFPTLIVSGFVMVAGLLSFFTGLILHVNMMNERRRFERELNRL